MARRNKFGCLPLIITTFIILVILGIGVVIFLPQSVNHLSVIEDEEVEDVLEELRIGVVEGERVFLDEEDLNMWLLRTMRGKQGAKLGRVVYVRRFWVDLHKGAFDFIIKKELMGVPMMISMHYEVRQEVGANKEGFITKIVGEKGKIGRLPIPGKFMALLEEFEICAEGMQEELQLVEQFLRIHHANIVLNEQGVTLEPWEGQ